VCENYPAKPWDGPSACGCGDAGMPCPACAREIVALPMIGDGALHRVIMQVQRQYFESVRPARAALVEPPREWRAGGGRWLAVFMRAMLFWLMLSATIAPT
jgi:hypothetical protein